jgi:O-antigen/teichoic acid export membrane protein
VVIPSALSGVLFPLFTRSLSAGDAGFMPLYRLGVSMLGLLIAPLAVMLALGAHDILQLWMGEAFAAEGSVVLKLLAVGLLANSYAHVPFAAIQAANRPDITAKLHVAEGLLYLPLLLVLTQAQGIRGAALAWTLRVGFDALVLTVLAMRVMRPQRAQILRAAGLLLLPPLALTLVAAIAGIEPMGPAGASLLAATLAYSAAMAWRSYASASFPRGAAAA